MKNTKSRIFFILCVLILFFQTISFRAPYNKQYVNQDWKVNINNCPGNSKSQGQSYQLQTTLPTTIHLDLINHKKIQDPFFSDNWQNQKWISQCNAFYKKKLIVTDEMMRYQVVNLVFQGIDTYANIKVNNKTILFAKNAFVQYRMNVKNLLNVGQNHIDVQINSTSVFDNNGQSQDNMPFPYAHTRKACYQYSWDWAPYMNTLGIWKEVYLQFYDEISIDYVWIQLQKLEEKEAILNFGVKLKKSQNFKNLQNYSLSIEHNGRQLNKNLIQGVQTYLLARIQNPKLWWPNGVGEPHVYDFKVKLISGQKAIHQKNITYGIKTVRLDLADNAFTVILNGYRIYCKGANYVPMDMLYPRLTNKMYHPEYNIEDLLKDTVRSNFNMIRVWGGGQYESDQFYQLASRMGIMIFHDFMFSDSIYPSKQEFLDNVLVQVTQQIRRLRNYPSLVLWSGNNQILQGIQSWGWNSKKYKEDYRVLFLQFIPNIIKTQSPYIPYIPSSPVYGIGNGNFNRGGDVHYWGVWAGGKGFESYQEAIGPFNSQFGTQALPVWQTIKQFTTQDGRSYQSNQFLSHQRHGSQFHTLRNYIETYGKKSLDFQLESYQSGLIQAFAIQIAIKAQRASKKLKSMGTLYWQLNDAWPGISWSSIDYFGRWKPLQYKAKNLYQNVIAFYQNKTGKIIALNDNLYDLNCSIQTKIMYFSGEVYKTYNISTLLRENQVKQIFELQKQVIERNASNILVYSKVILENGKQIGISSFLKPYKDLQLPKCALHVRFVSNKNEIKLAAKCLIKDVYIYHSSKYLHLTDNYIDIIPGEIHTVALLKQDMQSLQRQLKFRSYIQVYDAEQLNVIIQ